ncbi:hypothetical protein GOBAR_DD33402 [Gossypium barbadense]|nr:hypothetical protein GOBAR_DD33402 [Gossypium barbadense]
MWIWVKKSVEWKKEGTERARGANSNMEHMGPTLEGKVGRGQRFEDKAAWPSSHLHCIFSSLEGHGGSNFPHLRLFRS